MNKLDAQLAHDLRSSSGFFRGASYRLARLAALYRNVFIKRIPVHSATAEFEVLTNAGVAWSRRGSHASGTPSVRPSSISTYMQSLSKRSAIGEIFIPSPFKLLAVLLNQTLDTVEGWTFRSSSPALLSMDRDRWILLIKKLRGNHYVSILAADRLRLLPGMAAVGRPADQYRHTLPQDGLEPHAAQRG